MTLSTISLIRKIVTPALLDRISNKSKRQVEAIVAVYHPQEKIRDRVKPVVVEQLVKLPASGRSPGAFDSPPEIGPQCKDIYRRGGGKKSVTDEMSTPALEDTVVRRRVRMHEIRCMIDDGVMQDLERCKVLLSGKYPRGLDYSKLFNELASQWLERHDPVKRAGRREKKKPAVRDREKSRHISAAVRDEVFERDGGRCTFVGSTGKRCASTWDLEVHHDGTPYGRGGSHSIKNLKLLCAAHNRLEAERTYGQAHMQKFYIKESGVSCRTAYRIYGPYAGSEIRATRSSLDHHFYDGRSSLDRHFYDGRSSLDHHFCDGRSCRNRHIHAGQFSYDAINIITP